MNTIRHLHRFSTFLGMHRMRWTYVRAGIVWKAFVTSIVVAQGLPDHAQLRWRNGDTLTGSITSLDAEQIGWYSPVFAQPFGVRWNVLDTVEFVRPQVIRPAELTEVLTTGRNQFLGTVVGWDDQSVRLRTESFGILRLNRPMCQMLSKPTRSEVFVARRGLEDWQTLTFGRKLTDWTLRDDGALVTRRTAAELFRPIEADGPIEINLKLSWEQSPSFQIRFLTPFVETTKETISVESRDGVSVQSLDSRGRYRQLETFPRETRTIELTLRWDDYALELHIFQNQKFLGKIEVASQGENGPSGLQILNGGTDLAVESVTIIGNGQMVPRGLDRIANDRLVLRNGNVLTGTLSPLSNGEQEIQGHSSVTLVDLNGEERSVPWGDVTHVLFRTPADDSIHHQSAAEEPVVCQFHGGQTLRGRGIAQESQNGQPNKTFGFVVDGVDEPISCPFKDLLKIVFHGHAGDASEGEQYLQLGESTLRGELAEGNPRELSWQLQGAPRAVPLNLNHPCIIYPRVPAAPATTVLTDHTVDVIFLRSGELFSGQIEQIDAQGVHVHTQWTSDEVNIPRSEVKAIELSTDSFVPIVGFGSHGWVVNTPERVDMSERQLTLRPSASVANEHFARGDSIEFLLRVESKTREGMTLQIQLFADEPRRNQTLSIFTYQDHVYVLHPAHQAFRPMGKLRDGSGKFKIEQRDESLTIQCNDATLELNGIDRERTAWLGIGFQLTASNANRPQINPDEVHADMSVAISDFRIGASSRISGTLRQKAADVIPLLTVPRGSKTQPLQNLVVGINDDLLRGSLIDMTAQRLRFQSRERVIEVPREQAKGIIWIDHTEDDQQDGRHVGQQEQMGDGNQARFVLQNGYVVRLNSPSLPTDDTIVGEHSLMGTVRFQLNEIREILLGSTPSPPLAYSYHDWNQRQPRDPVLKEVTTGDGHAIDSPLMGTIADEIDLPCCQGERFRLADQRGRVVVLHFWATWDPDCVTSIPRLIEAVSKFDPARVVLVGINELESIPLVLAMNQARGWDWRVPMDGTGEIAERFAASDVPHTVIVDQHGVIRHVYHGASSRLSSEMESAVEQLLRQPSAGSHSVNSETNADLNSKRSRSETAPRSREP